jgi:nitroreductase
MSFNKYLEKTIQKSQHCNRNWDLSKQISQEDLETLKVSVTKCSSKQNRVFYKVLYTQDRDKIKAIHKATDGFVYDFENQKTTTNSQVLANTLFAFVKDSDTNVRTNEEWQKGKEEGRSDIDEDRSVGIAAGYLTLAANLLGYETGCCQCMDTVEVKNILGSDSDVLLLMGVGIGDKTRSRLEHHDDPSFRFPSFTKNIKIEVA